MIKYREILRLSSMGLSQRSIASSCQCSRNTVSNVLSRAEQKGLEWPLPEDIGDADIQQMLFPDKAQAAQRKIPDCDYMHREMAKSGVTLSLLWIVRPTAWVEKYHLSTPNIATITGSLQPRPKATMHIARKPD